MRKSNHTQNKANSKKNTGKDKDKVIQPANSNFKYWILWFVFVLVSAIGAFRHELWQDELQAWIIARQSASPAELLHNLRFEGHPALWHFFLWITHYFTNAPEAMQVWHWLFISVAAWFLVFKSPFSFTERVLILFGYFFLFEYNVVPRNYALGVLFFTVILSCFKSVNKHLTWVGICSFLMANANLYAALVVAVLGLTLLWMLLDENKYKIKNINPKLFVPYALLFAGLLVSALQIMPNEHNRNYLRYPDGLDYERIKFSFANFIKVFLPIPDLAQTTWWNTTVFIKNPMQISNEQFLLAFLLFIVPVVWFRRNKWALFIYLAGSLLVTTFTYITWVPYVRYIGHIYLAFLAACWVDRLTLSSQQAGFEQNFKQKGFWVILVIQTVSGIMAFTGDIKDKFSRVKETATFIKQNKLDQNIIFGYTDYTTTGLCAYLDKPLFFVQRDTFGYFVYWDDKRNHFMDIKTALDSAASKIKNKPGNYLFASSMQIMVTNNGVQTPLFDSVYLNNRARLVFINKFDKAVTGNDNFFLYKLSNL